MRAAVITVSTSLAAGEGEDRSGPELVRLCEEAGLETSHEVVPDDREAIKAALIRWSEEGCRFVFTTGGTGLTIDDVTPEATRDAIHRDAPSTATVPACGRSSVASTRRSVVLPAPFAPNTASV